jgi:signal peptidase I
MDTTKKRQYGEVVANTLKQLARMKKPSRFLSFIFLGVSLTFLMALLVPSFTDLHLAPVVSGSMEPAIKTGAKIGIAKVDPASVRVGDIIGFSIPGIGTRVCHRVIGLVDTETGYGFITKGDANENPDAWVVQPQDVIGKVYFSTSSLLPLMRFIKSPTGFILFIGLPALILVVLLINEISIWKKKSQSDLAVEMREPVKRG